MQVDLRRLDRFMAEPEGDHCAADTVMQQRHGCAVPQAERAATVAGEQRSVVHVALLVDPGFENLRRFAPQGRGAVLAPLAMAAPGHSARTTWRGRVRRRAP